LKHFFVVLLLKFKLLIAAVMKLGALGLLLISAMDASSLAVPMDVIVATFVWNDRARFWLYPLVAALGSAAGSLVPFLLGRAGGELFLLKRINRERYERMRDRFERQEFLALFIPAMLPPPTPFKLFVFAAGVFEMRVGPFLLATFAGRLVRFSALALLTMRYGPQAVHRGVTFAHQHRDTVLTVAGLAVLAVMVFVVRKVYSRRARPGDLSAKSIAE
jgi:membrane protein YqaA with SNARE-associated domain